MGSTWHRVVDPNSHIVTVDAHSFDGVLGSALIRKLLLVLGIARRVTELIVWHENLNTS